VRGALPRAQDGLSGDGDGAVPSSTKGSPAANSSAASRDVKIAIEPSVCGSANVPTMSSRPRAWNSWQRSQCSGKCGGTFDTTSSADS
jgi:hypothetical protein